MEVIDPIISAQAINLLKQLAYKPDIPEEERAWIVALINKLLDTCQENTCLDQKKPPY